MQAVLSYWGKDVDEAELMKLLRTSEEVGTYPEEIVRVAQSFGFYAEAKEHLTLDEVAQSTAGGVPIIALAQVWRSQKGSVPSVDEEWDSGHYVVVLAVDDGYVYFQDPFVRMSKAFVPRKAFEEHWHHAMGGDPNVAPKLMQLGIFIRGDRSAQKGVGLHPGSSLPEFRKLGSFNLMTIQFGGFLLPFDFLDELRAIWERGDIRPDAFIFLRRDAEGRLSGLEGSRLREEDDIASINALLAAIATRSLGPPELSQPELESALRAAAEGDFGLSAVDIHKIGDRVPPGHSAIIVLFENVWEREFREAANRYGGYVISQRLITSEALAKIASELTAGP